MSVLRLDLPWEENRQQIRTTRFSRYPLVEREGARPIGIIHLKNLFLAAVMEPLTPDQLRRLARPCPGDPGGYAAGGGPGSIPGPLRPDGDCGQCSR